MRKLLPQLLMTLAAVALPQIVRAQDSPEPQRPSAESLFKRLDVNKDGFITPDEIPAAMPERLKQLLIDADKNSDKKITLDELKAAFQERAKARQANRPEAGPDGRPGPRGEDRTENWAAARFWRLWRHGDGNGDGNAARTRRHGRTAGDGSALAPRKVAPAPSRTLLARQWVRVVKARRTGALAAFPARFSGKSAGIAQLESPI